MSGLTPSALVFPVCVFFARLALYCAVKTSPDGSMDTYFCEPQGCANNVTTVFCNDTVILDHRTVTKECEDLPPLNTVCKHAGWAFVSTHTGESCEFEGNGYYIATAKCQEPANYPICAFDRESPEWTTAEIAYLVVGLLGTGIILVVCFIGFKFISGNPQCHTQCNREPNEEAADDPNEGD